ncbi:MAG: nitric oxide reductase activation protein NorD [Burkholderiaceae bacterium]
MPEAEDVITDVARHATIYAREVWRRHGISKPAPGGARLIDLAQRLDLLITAAFGNSYPLRVAQIPAPRTFLSKIFRRSDAPAGQIAVPATDGRNIWLPARIDDMPALPAVDCYRALALREAMRASRNGASLLKHASGKSQRALFIVIEAWVADHLLARQLPGMVPALAALRSAALNARPNPEKFPVHHQALEKLVRAFMTGAAEHALPATPAESLALSEEIARALAIPGRLRSESECLLKDLWTGDMLESPEREPTLFDAQDMAEDELGEAPPRSASLPRRPEVREASEDEDDSKPGAWMVQTSHPHEQAEDPIGMQRPTDRDEETAAEEFADSLSELNEARLVTTPGRRKEVLMSDDAPAMQAGRRKIEAATGISQILSYPEWDYRAHGYREPGAHVHVTKAQLGPQEWVDQTLEEYRAMAHAVRRQFETLRAQRTRLKRRLEGEDIDLEAYVESYADFKAGLPLAQAMYQQSRTSIHDLAVMLLIDVSGSTDAWVSSGKRIIDVEREALLLVSIAMQAMGAPYAVMGFSGEGPQGVVVRTVKSFTEPYGEEVARRISALEPEHYTRAGAALRHASAELMQQRAGHRLLLLLSDGKPNDMDEYEGRYGVEDMRQAVTEAKMQGIYPFCLTIDRHAADYLPKVFGAHQYALLQKPELLPTVLLEWMKRLVSA